jgi:hypothetical protein
MRAPLASALVAIGCSVGCASAPSSPVPPAVSPATTTTSGADASDDVGDLHLGCTTITRADVDTLRGQLAVVDAEHVPTPREAQTTLVETALAERIADVEHVSVSDDEADNAIDDMALQLNVSRAELESEVVRRGWSVEHYRAFLRRQILVWRVGILITPPTARQAVEAEVDRRLASPPEHATREQIEQAAALDLMAAAMHAEYARRASQWAAVRVERSNDACVER